MILTIYDTHDGQQKALVHEHDIGGSLLRLTNRRVTHYCILAWAPSSEALLFCMQGLFHVMRFHTLEQGNDFVTVGPILIRPNDCLEAPEGLYRAKWVHPDKLSRLVLPATGWMPGNFVMVSGSPTPSRVAEGSAIRNPKSDLFLISLDGSILGQWRSSDGGASQRSPSDYSWPSKAVEDAWMSSQHLLEPIWSQGVPGLLQPHDLLIARLSDKMDSGIGLGLQPLHGVELSPCGNMMLAAPPHYSPKGAPHRPFCTLLVWDKQRLEMVRHATKLPSWQKLAWHPAASIHPFLAMIVNGDVLLVDCRSPKSPMRWYSSDLYKDRYPHMYEAPWDSLAWTPDGTKILLVSRKRITAIEFLPSPPPKPVHKNKAWQGLQTKLQKLLL